MRKNLKVVLASTSRTKTSFVMSRGVAGLMVCAMLLAGCATTSTPQVADPSKMQFLRVDPAAQAFRSKYAYKIGADIRVYESDRDVFVFIQNHEDWRQQKINQLTTGQELAFQPPSVFKVQTSADDLMRSLNARLVFDGSLIPGRSVYHGRARDLGIEYYLRPYKMGGESGDISVEFALYSEVIKRARDAMVARDVGLMPAHSNGRGLPYFLTDFTDKHVDLVTSLDDLKRLETVIERVGGEDKSLLCFIERRRIEIRFHELSLIATTPGDLQQLRDFQRQPVPGCFLPSTINVGTIRRSDAASMMPRLAGTAALASSERRVAAILDEAKKKAHEEKIASLRSRQTFSGYWDAYQLTKAPSDIKSAYMAASSDGEKILAEKGIVMALPPTSIFDVKIMSRQDSPLRTGRSSGLFQSTKAQVKDISRRVVVTIRKDIPFAVQHADYSITLKFREMLELKPPINGRDRDFVEKSLTFDLRKSNGWRSEQVLVFDGIPVSGTFRPGGVKALNFMSGLFGGPRINEGDLDVDFKLQGSELKYEMEGRK